MEKHAIEEEISSSEELSSDEEARVELFVACVGHYLECHTRGWSSILFIRTQLQLDFTKGKLKPGLITRAMPSKTYTNNVVCNLQ